MNASFRVSTCAISWRAILIWSTLASGASAQLESGVSDGAPPSAESAPKGSAEPVTPPASAAVPEAASPAPTPPPLAPSALATPASVERAPVPPPEPPCPESEKKHDDAEGMGAFLIGVGVLDLAKLNDRLSANGYERLDSRATFVGGEGHAVMKSGLVVGGRGAALLGPEGSGPGDLRAELSGGFGMAEFGFAPVHTRLLLFAVVAGFGGYGFSLDISNARQDRFDNVLAHPERSSSLSRGGLLVGLTLGFDVRVPIGDVKENRRPFFSMGLRGGGLYGIPLGDWGLSDGSKLTAGPAFSLTSAYAGVALGFGSAPASDTQAKGP